MHETYKHKNTLDADFTLNAILDISSEGFWDWNAKTGFVHRSAGWFKMLGYEYETFKSDVFTWENAIHQDDYERVMSHFEGYISGKIAEYKIEYRCKKSDGSYLSIEDSGKIVEKNDDGSVARMIGAHTNIHENKLFKDALIRENQLLQNSNISLENLVEKRTEELKLANEKLSLQIKEANKNASFDLLTGLYNRREFERLFKKEIYRSKRYTYSLAVLLFDIDHFKRVNDNFGHKTGDQILIGVTSLVQKLIREGDILARWGGEEFVIVLPETSIDEAVLKAENIRKEIENKTFVKDLKITCSFGVSAIFGSKQDSAELVFERCDKALYEAKNSGRNNVKMA